MIYLSHALVSKIGIAILIYTIKLYILMLTYSINDGTVTSSSNLGSISDVLTQLPDNTTHLISPSDVRNAIYTMWNNAGVLKPTSISASNIEYIGFDHSMTGLSLKEKILLGKRQYNGRDTMTDSLLNGASDLFIFNNKSDSDNQYSTRISILSGTNSSIYDYAPYIESLYVIGTSSIYQDLNLINPEGNINLISTLQNVSINNLILPSIADNATASNGYVLRYYTDGTYSYAKWYEEAALALTNITSDTTITLTAPSVIINGHDMEYTNSTPTPATLGGVLAGSTFSKVALVDMLTRLLYPYIPATDIVTLLATVVTSNSMVGYGTSNLIVEKASMTSTAYTYNITKGTYQVQTIVSIPAGSDSSTKPETYRLVGTSSVPVPVVDTNYTIVVTDGTQSTTTTAALKIVYPYFYGATTSVISTSGITTLLTKITQVKNNNTITWSGNSVHLYYAYPSVYPDLTRIVESTTGYNFIDAFTQTIVTVSSSLPVWSTTYKVYTYTAGSGVCDVTNTNNSTWTFIH